MTLFNTDTAILEKEKRACFDFFWNETNTDETSPAYGLTRDTTRAGKGEVASIAANGFGLAAIVIGVENGYISREDGEKRALGTLRTFLDHAEHVHGFFYHFLDMRTAKRYEPNYDCASIIDTSILLNGMLTAAEYFGGAVKELAYEIYKRADWSIYVNPETNCFYMGVRKETGGFAAWDMYAEQLMQYFLAVGSPTTPVDPVVYDSFSREKVTYAGYSFMTAPRNALFTHQFSHAWFDFSQYLDKDGIDYADNSRQATLAQRQFAIDHEDTWRTFNEHSWGQSACQGPTGYKAYGTAYDNIQVKQEQDGTIAPTAASGSIVFTPEESLDAMNYMAKLPNVWGKYGLQDSYNFDVTPDFVADEVIGIDKGITLLMIENYQTNLIWDLYMKNEFIQSAARKLGFVKK